MEANVSLSVTAFTTLYAHYTHKWPPKGELDTNADYLFATLTGFPVQRQCEYAGHTCVGN